MTYATAKYRGGGSGEARHHINTQFPEGDTVPARIPELVEQVRTARDAGFVSLWFPHHYLTAPLQMLQITPLMAYPAARRAKA